jgi:hypothetical protein
MYYLILENKTISKLSKIKKLTIQISSNILNFARSIKTSAISSILPEV